MTELLSDSAERLSTLLADITEKLSSYGLTTTVLTTSAAGLIVLYNWPVWNRYRYPPGPWPLPFVGHALWMARSPNIYKEIYGE